MHRRKRQPINARQFSDLVSPETDDLCGWSLRPVFRGKKLHKDLACVSAGLAGLPVPGRNHSYQRKDVPDNVFPLSRLGGKPLVKGERPVFNPLHGLFGDVDRSADRITHLCENPVAFSPRKEDK